jgi:hypothetical protein
LQQQQVLRHNERGGYSMTDVVGMTHDYEQVACSFDDFGNQGCGEVLKVEGTNDADSYHSEADDSYSVDDEFNSLQEKEADEGGNHRPPLHHDHDHPQVISEAKSLSGLNNVEALSQQLLVNPNEGGQEDSSKSQPYQIHTKPTTTEDECNQIEPLQKENINEQLAPTHHASKTKRRPTAFVPRCAFAETKSNKFKKAGGLQIVEQKSTKVKKYSLDRLEKLAKPVEHRLYSADKSGKTNETTPKPKKLSLEDSNDFFERMQAKEAERKEKLQLAAAKAQYEAKVDKKVCPSCGTVQSFEEMTKGRMDCRNEQCKSGKHQYLPPRQFKLGSFEERMKRSAQRRKLILDRIEDEQKSIVSKAASQKTSRIQQELKAKIKDDFESRTINDIRQRKEKLATKTVRAMLENEYPYKPNLNVPEQLIKNRQGGIEYLSTPSSRYTEEYQPPDDEIEQMKRNTPKWKGQLPTRHHTRTVDDDVLKQSFNSR